MRAVAAAALALTALLLLASAATHAAEHGDSRFYVFPIGVKRGVTRSRGLLESGKVDVDGSVHVGYFYATLPLGTPPSYFNVIVDTGSTVTYVPCADCAHCGRHDDAPFNPSASKTAKWVGCRDAACAAQPSVFVCGDRRAGGNYAGQCIYSISYAEQSSSEGRLVTDVFSFPGAADAAGSSSSGSVVVSPSGGGGGGKVPVTFGCVNSESGEIFKQKPDGLVGMGNSPGAFHGQLAAAGAIAHVFSLCFGFPSGGAMLLGAAPLPGNPAFTWLPLLRTGWPDFFTLQMTSISFGAAPLDVPAATYRAGYGTVLDSGTTFIYLVTFAFRAFLAAARAAASAAGLKETTDSFGDVCWKGLGPDFADLDRHFPTVRLQFGGGANMSSLALPPYRYMFQLSRKGSYCLAVFDNGESGSLLGGIATRNVLVQYDLERRRVGFADMDCHKLGTMPASEFKTAHAKPSRVQPAVLPATAAAAGGAAAAAAGAVPAENRPAAAQPAAPAAAAAGKTPAAASPAAAAAAKPAAAAAAKPASAAAASPQASKAASATPVPASAAGTAATAAAAAAKQAAPAPAPAAEQAAKVAEALDEAEQVYDQAYEEALSILEKAAEKAEAIVDEKVKGHKGAADDQAAGEDEDDDEEEEGAAAAGAQSAAAATAAAPAAAAAAQAAAAPPAAAPAPATPAPALAAPVPAPAAPAPAPVPTSKRGAVGSAADAEDDEEAEFEQQVAAVVAAAAATKAAGGDAASDASAPSSSGAAVDAVGSAGAAAAGAPAGSPMLSTTAAVSEDLLVVSSQSDASGSGGGGDSSSSSGKALQDGESSDGGSSSTDSDGNGSGFSSATLAAGTQRLVSGASPAVTIGLFAALGGLLLLLAGCLALALRRRQIKAAGFSQLSAADVDCELAGISRLSGDQRYDGHDGFDGRDAFGGALGGHARPPPPPRLASCDVSDEGYAPQQVALAGGRAGSSSSCAEPSSSRAAAADAAATVAAAVEAAYGLGPDAIKSPGRRDQQQPGRAAAAAGSSRAAERGGSGGLAPLLAPPPQQQQQQRRPAGGGASNNVVAVFSLGDDDAAAAAAASPAAGGSSGGGLFASSAIDRAGDSMELIALDDEVPAAAKHGPRR